MKYLLMSLLLLVSVEAQSAPKPDNFVANVADLRTLALSPKIEDNFFLDGMIFSLAEVSNDLGTSCTAGVQVKYVIASVKTSLLSNQAMALNGLPGAKFILASLKLNWPCQPDTRTESYGQKAIPTQQESF